MKRPSGRFCTRLTRVYASLSGQFKFGQPGSVHVHGPKPSRADDSRFGESCLACWLANKSYVKYFVSTSKFLPWQCKKILKFVWKFKLWTLEFQAHYNFPTIFTISPFRAMSITSLTCPKILPYIYKDVQKSSLERKVYCKCWKWRDRESCSFGSEGQFWLTLYHIIKPSSRFKNHWRFYLSSCYFGFELIL